MNKPILLFTALAGLLLFSKASAQVDTTQLDLGRMQLKKDFTQHITIKGEDLEKMPFDNLAEAINVWFYGSYTNTANLVYVIDGNLVNDVNAYSIYDIDEVTLVQSALSHINGTVQQQQLVLIKTKRPKNKGYGVTASGQAYVSNLFTNNIPDQNDNYQTGLKSTTTVYQQYNVSAYKNTDNIQFGVSANYLRDVLPEIKESITTYNTPETFNRFRFNGYFDAKIGNSILDITAGYAPQKEKEDMYEDPSGGSTEEIQNDNEHMWNASIRLTTHIATGFVNTVHADYNNYRVNGNENTLDKFTIDTAVIVSKNNTYNHAIVAYDNLSYDAKFGNWGLLSSANLSFRTVRDSSYFSSFSLDQNGSTAGSSFEEYFHEHIFLLTPSLNLYYKNYFNVEAGLLYDMSMIGSLNLYNNTDKTTKLFPFVSTSADVMQLFDPGSTLSVKVYGSYSLSSSWVDNFNTLQDFTYNIVQLPVLGSTNNEQTNPYLNAGDIDFVNYAYEVQQQNKTFKTFSAGLTVSPVKSGLVFSYFFEKSNYLSPIYVLEPFGANSTSVMLIYTNTNSTLNRVGVDYTLNTRAFQWHTGLNATMLEQKYPVNFGPEPSTGSNEWTGGWVNRLGYKSFFAGVDVLYQIGAKTYTYTAPDFDVLTASKFNSFSLQNLYAGYRVKVAGTKNLEIFANARNLFQNQKEDITDSRKYYGLGFNLSL
jgi:hypothetical protein